MVHEFLIKVLIFEAACPTQLTVRFHRLRSYVLLGTMALFGGTI